MEYAYQRLLAYQKWSGIMIIYVGIDVGKNSLDICHNGKILQVTNDLEGIDILIQELHNYNLSNDSIVITCEPTGGYERLLVTSMREKGYSVHMAHPNKIRSFAKSKGVLAKTDKLDSTLIQQYAEIMRVKNDQQYTTQNQEQLAQLINRRNQLIADRTREQARSDKQLSQLIKESVQLHITWLEKEIDKIECEISSLSQQDETIKAKIDLLASIPSIGQLTALTLVSYLPELGQMDHASLSALVGIAPFNRDSGQYRGKRFIQGGRAIVRKALYMASISGIRHNTVLVTFYQRLIKNGKPTKVALVAVMRKLLTIANSILSRNTPWLENNS